MKTKHFLFLLLILILFPLSALSEAPESPYIPGSITRSLFTEAFSRGDMILADIQLGFSLSEGAHEVFGEDTAAITAAAQALEHACLTIGAGKMEDGLRVLLGAQYAPKEAQSVDLSAMLELTLQGLSLTSSVIPGERFTASWESLLSLAGVDEISAAAILSLRSVDFMALAEQIRAQLPALAQTASEMAAPYMETILAHMAALPIERYEGIPAEGGYPAAAAELYIPVSQKDLGSLVDALAAQLEQDAVLCAMIDMLLAQSGEQISTAALCAAVRENAALLTDAQPLVQIYMGLDEADNPIYLHVSASNFEGMPLVLSCIPSEGETEGSTVVTIDLLTLTADEMVDSGFSLAIEFFEDPANSLIGEFGMGLVIYAGGTPAAEISFYAVNASSPTEDGQEGYAGAYGLNVAAAGESVTQLDQSVQFMQSRTAEGGEQFAAAGAMDIPTEDGQLSVSFDSYMLTTPTAEGPLTTMTEFVRSPMPGVDEYYESTALYTAACATPDDLTETALETAPPEALDALAQRAMTALENTLTALVELLPEPLPNLAGQHKDVILPVQP